MTIFNGNGKMTFDDGSVYEGTWVNDKRHGNFVVTFPSGNIIEVEYKNGELVGDDTRNII